MEVELKKLLNSISKSVLEAQQALDMYSAEHFLHFVSQEHTPENQEAIQSVSFAYGKNGQEEVMVIPYAALMHHRPLLLDEVTLDAYTFLRYEGDQVMAELAPMPLVANLSAEDGKPNTIQNTSQACKIHLTFKANSPSEGIARITNQLNKPL